MALGRKGEQLADQYLRSHGFEIRDRNFRTRAGELDFVAQKDSKIHFIEVKTRVGDAKGKPYESVRFHKLKHLRRAIDMYLLKNNLREYKLSFGVISIVINPKGGVETIDFFEEMGI